MEEAVGFDKPRGNIENSAFSQCLPPSVWRSSWPFGKTSWLQFLGGKRGRGRFLPARSSSFIARNIENLVFQSAERDSKGRRTRLVAKCKPEKQRASELAK
jgi:hypothetical protein